MSLPFQYDHFDFTTQTDKAFYALRGGEHCQNREHQELLDIIRYGRILTVFQPIFNLETGEIYACECLSRVRGATSFSRAEQLFEAARKFELTHPLEQLCLSRAVETAQKMGIKEQLTLNVSPSLFQEGKAAGSECVSMAENLFVLRDRVILELTEKCYIRDSKCFRETLSTYKKEGFRIAIDDLGAGFAGLKMLAELEPSVVKIDRFLITDIARSTKKRMLVDSLVSFCHKINAQVVAEGIETREDLEVMLSMRVDLGQGFFLARPASLPQQCAPDAKAIIMKNREDFPHMTMDENRIGSLVRYADPIDITEWTEMIIRRFKSDPNLRSVPVLRDRKPVGIVNKGRLFFKLGQQFGYAIYSQRSPEKVMEPALVFESETPLEEVSRKVLARNEDSKYDAIVVVQNGVYMGIVEIHILYERISRQRLLLAMQANPLTGLPGNHLIKTEIVQRLEQNQLFAVLYFDLDNFKPFNDHFGFERGDQVIRFLATLLKDSVRIWDLRAFVGHVGGDDFVVVCAPQNIKKLCEMVLKRFQEGVKEFHDAEAVKSGQYISVDRSGQPRAYGLLSVSIAVVTTINRSFESYGQMVSVASEVKKKAKSISGNSFYVDLRGK